MTAFMYMNLIIFCLLLIHGEAACPCKDASLCDNIKVNYTKELYGFIGGGNSQVNDTSQYNWTYTTALAVNYADTNITGMNNTMCVAHSNKVRMILWNYPHMPLTNDNNTIMTWIQEVFNYVKFLNYDGITIDYEGSMLWNDPKMAYYVNLVDMTTQYFHENLPGSTVSICVPFMAYLQWGRQYDYVGLAKASDYLYIMGYDTNGQIWDGQCMARAVSPIMNIQRGVQSYINLGIDPFKLILGVPWYGKINECLTDEMPGGLITGKYCPILNKDNKGVNCSNGGWHANPEQSYAEIMSKDCNGKQNVTEIRWDNTQKSSFCNYWFSHGNTTLMQVWFDNPESLTIKYQYAKSMNLRGLGPFQFGDLIWDHSDEEKERAQQMWAAFDAFYLD